MSTYICVSSYISIYMYMCVYMLISLTEKFTHLTGCGGNPGHVLKRFPSLMCPFWHMKVHASCTEVMGTGQEFQEEPDEGQQPAPPWFTLVYLGLPPSLEAHIELCAAVHHAVPAFHPRCEAGGIG